MTTRKDKGADRQAKVDNALATLRTGVETLVQSDSWLDYLAFQAKFHRYSANNVLLIMVQRPDATQVAGYRAWQALGRQVRKGEKGIVILAPCRRTVEDEETGERRSWIAGFTTAHVWDVSQTDGEPLPESPVALLTDGDGDDALHAALVAQIVAAGFAYVDGDAEEAGAGANGFTDFEARRVVVGAELPAAQRVKTTAHELAHVLMHDPTDPDRPAERGLCEVEAESVAFVVLHACGFDAGSYSFGYVAGWSGGKPEAVETVARRVQRTATRILEAATDREEVPA